MPRNLDEHWQCQTCFHHFPSDEELHEHIEAFQVRNEEFLAAVIGLTFYSLVRGTCSPNYRNVSHIPILNYLMRKIAGPLTTTALMVRSMMMATDAKSSYVRIQNAKANKEHHSGSGKTLCDIILFVFLSFLQYMGFEED
jgi:hypothetical protein